MELNYYTIQITGGTSQGPYTIYYTTVSPTNIGILYPSNNPAQNIPLNNLQTGVEVGVPDNTTLIIVYNELCDTTQTVTITPPVICVDFCLTYQGEKQIQFECNGVDQNGVLKWISTPNPNCEVLWDNTNNRWYLTCQLNGDDIFSNDPFNSNPPTNWFSVGTGILGQIIVNSGLCQPQTPLILNVSLNQPGCVCDGSITLNANGGTPPYQYSIDNGITFQSSPLFTSICPGNYSVMVKDITDTTSNEVVVINQLLPSDLYSISTFTNPQTITDNTQQLNKLYTTNVLISPPLPNGVTVTFDFIHLGIFENTRQPGFSSLNRVVTLNKNGNPIGVTSTNSVNYTGPTTPQCDVPINSTVQYTATTNSWNSITMTQGDIIQIITTSNITFTSQPTICDFGLDTNQWNISNVNIQGCDCCDIEILNSEISEPQPNQIWQGTGGFATANASCIFVNQNGPTQTYYTLSSFLGVGIIVYENTGTFFTPIYTPLIGNNLFYAIGNQISGTYSSFQINNSGEITSIGNQFCIVSP